MQSPASLIVLIWLALLSSLNHIAHRGQQLELIAYAITLMACLVAILVEAGNLESQERSKVTVPVRVLALMALIGHTIVCLKP